MTNDPSIDPNHPNFEQLVEERLKQYAEEYSIETYPAEHRSHLGASSIGEDCWRKLWYQFRWVKLHHAEGRMRRLLNRGHREEKVLERFLMWSGFTVKSIDPDTSKQYTFSKVNGHYGGSTDGTMQIRWANNFPIVVDYKTFADKYFKEIKEKKVRIAQPKYFDQLSSYGKEFNATHGLLFGVNKNDDEWYFEFFKLDWNRAIELEKKAADIIHSPTPPPKINENPSYWKCKFCHISGICHFNEPVEKNCRSCVNSMPGENGTWICSKYGTIPKEFIKDGCGEWKGIV